MELKTELAEMKASLSAFMSEVKQRFSEVPAVEIAFGELTLVDGTIVVFEGEELAAGMMLSVKGEEGIVPAPDGVHETTTGLLVTTKDGVVETIETKEAPVEEVEVENQFASVEQFDALRAANEELAAKIATLETALVNVLGKVEETFSVFEKFAATTPAPTKKPFGSVKKNEETFNGFVSAIKSIKK